MFDGIGDAIVATFWLCFVAGLGASALLTALIIFIVQHVHIGISQMEHLRDALTVLGWAIVLALLFAPRPPRLP